MTTKVINAKDREDYPADQVVYIGRPSPWGNPYVMGRDGTRDEVVDEFESFFLNKVEEDAEFREKTLKELKGKILMCYCKPEACHGDIIAEWCDSQSAQEAPVVAPRVVLEGPLFCEGPNPIQIHYKGAKEETKEEKEEIEESEEEE